MLEFNGDFQELISLSEKSLSKKGEGEDKKENSIDRSSNNNSNMAANYVASSTAHKMTQKAAQTFAKPDTFTGNRSLYDNGAAKVNAKKNLFQNNKVVVDPYTGDRLCMTKNEAKLLYGEDWTKHLAESDHVKPLEQIYNDTKKNVWNSVEDINKAANSDSNIEVTSRKYNNVKRSRTNEQLVDAEEYRKSKDLDLSPEAKEKAIKRGELAEKSINKQLKKDAIRNIAKTGHNAGMEGAKSSGVTAATMSGIMNIVSVIKGEKESKEAIADTVKAGGKAAVTGYVMTGGITVAMHSFSASSSKIVQGLVKSNVPGKVINAVLATGDTLKRWGNGTITTQDCIVELGEKGLNMATMGYSMAVGQALIPIPIVGGAVGALVGSMLTSSYYNNLISELKTKQFEHQERLRIIEECHIAAEKAKAFRQELEEYLQSYFKEYRECFDSALSSIRFSFETGDADGVIAGANDITRKLGGNVYYDSVDEFKSFLNNEEVDIF